MRGFGDHILNYLHQQSALPFISSYDLIASYLTSKYLVFMRIFDASASLLLCRDYLKQPVVPAQVNYSNGRHVPHPKRHRSSDRLHALSSLWNRPPGGIPISPIMDTLIYKQQSLIENGIPSECINFTTERASHDKIPFAALRMKALPEQAAQLCLQNLLLRCQAAADGIQRKETEAACHGLQSVKERYASGRFNFNMASELLLDRLPDWRVSPAKSNPIIAAKSRKVDTCKQSQLFLSRPENLGPAGCRQ